MNELISPSIHEWLDFPEIIHEEHIGSKNSGKTFLTIDPKWYEYKFPPIWKPK